ncbi:MAG TPA: copper resistance CopC family protein [Pilimelia sp.]|nr:copper resistance CopC family protein [Pilimelia sp.]
MDPSRRRRARTAAPAALAAVALALVPAAPAAAHNMLVSASPDKDATLKTAPAKIELRFLQPLDPAFTTIVLTDGGRQKVPTAEPSVTGAKGTVTIGRPLASGVYSVAYRVVSTDGHPVQGSYQFTVAGPGPGPAASAASAPPVAPPGAPVGPEAAGAADEDALPTGLLVAGAAVLVAGAAVLLVRALRRRATVD